MEQLCHLGGFEPHVVHYMDQLLTAYYLASEGTGITVVRDSALYRVAQTQNLFFYKLPPDLACRNIYLTYRKKEESKALMQLFLHYVQSQSNRFFAQKLSLT